MNPTNNQYAFALHGGAGAVAGRNYNSVEEHLTELTRKSEALLSVPVARSVYAPR